MKLFIETFTEQFSTFALLRASSKAQLKEREEKFVSGLRVQPSLLRKHRNGLRECVTLSLRREADQRSCISAHHSLTAHSRQDHLMGLDVLLARAAIPWQRAASAVMTLMCHPAQAHETPAYSRRSLMTS